VLHVLALNRSRLWQKAIRGCISNNFCRPPTSIRPLARSCLSGIVGLHHRTRRVAMAEGGFARR